MAKRQTSTTQRGQVKLREKKLADGNYSLYLDIYSNGKPPVYPCTNLAKFFCFICFE